MDGLSGLLQSLFCLLFESLHLSLECAILLLGFLYVVGDARQELLVVGLQKFL